MTQWRKQAACLGIEPQTFDTPQGATYCRRCPVKAACAADALEREDIEVVRAGVFISAARLGNSRKLLRQAARGYRMR